MPLIGATVRPSADLKPCGKPVAVMYIEGGTATEGSNRYSSHITECRLWGLNGWGALCRSSNGSFMMHGKEFESDRVETGREF